MQWLTIVFFFHLHQRNQNIDLVFVNEENAFPVFVACDSGGYSILTDSHLRNHDAGVNLRPSR